MLARVEDVIRGKHLLIVSSGALASLPPHVLVTKRPKTAILSRLADYRGVDWLGTRHSITVLPSVASLKALRQYAKVSHASKHYLGIGNPLWTGRKTIRTWATTISNRQKPHVINRDVPSERLHRRLLWREARGLGASHGFRGWTGNISFLRRLTPLPATTDELCAIAGRLGVVESEILLGELATETRIKDLRKPASSPITRSFTLQPTELWQARCGVRPSPGLF